MAEFVFRDDRQRELDRTATLANGVPKAPRIQNEPAESGGGFQAFDAALEAQNPFKQKQPELRSQLRENIGETLANPTQGFQPIATQARDQFNQDLSANREEARQAAIKAFGPGTGQSQQFQRQQTNQELMAQQGFEGALAAEQARFGQQAQAQALQGGLQLESIEQAGELERARLGQQDQQFAASLGIQEKQLTQQERQFLQDMSLRRDQLTQQDRQFIREIQERQRSQESVQSFQAEQADLNRIFSRQERIGSEEFALRAQNAQNSFEASQSDLNRELEQLLSSDRIQAQFAIQEREQNFSERMTRDGWVNDQEMEEMRNEFQLELQQSGFDFQTAERIANQEFGKLEAQRERDYQATQADVQRSWATGERVEAQTWQTSIQAADQRFESIQNQMQREFQLDIEENRQTFTSAERMATQEYNRMIIELGFGHEEAMQQSAQVFQSQLQQAGFTQEKALQGTQMHFQAAEAQKDRAQQEYLAGLQMAQQDNQFKAQLMQERDISQQQLDLRSKELESNLETAGLQREQITSAMNDQNVKNMAEMVILGLEMLPESAPEEAYDALAEGLATTMAKYYGDQGIDINPEDIAAGFRKQGTGNTGTGNTGSNTGTSTGGSDSVPFTPLNRDDIAAIMSQGTIEFAERAKGREPIEARSVTSISDRSRKDIEAMDKSINAHAGSLGLNPDLVKQSFGGVGDGWTGAINKDGFAIGTLARIWGEVKERQSAYEIASTILGQDQVNKAIKAATGTNVSDWLKG